jgi:TatD DNase family protein
MQLVDIGANLTHESFQEDFDQVLSDARLNNVNQLIVTGASRQSSHEALALATKFPDQLWATAGIHPHHAEETTEAVIEELRLLAGNKKIKAVGETGLDYFRDFSPRETQRKSFEAHIELAIESGLPMFLHERDAHKDFAEILRSHRQQLNAVVVHCFTGDKDALHDYIDLDCYIGITGWICDERRGTHLIPLVTDVPENRLMIETDAPYLMPRNIKPKPKSRRNEPKNLPHICEFLARCLNRPAEDVAESTTINAQRFFNLESNR